MFKERKAAQIAAYFLSKAGGSMPRLKLMYRAHMPQPTETEHSTMSI